MGMNCGFDGLYAGKNGMMSAGTDKIEASDFKAANFGVAVGMAALIALASGCIALDRKEIMGKLVKDGDFEGAVDYELKAAKVGDSLHFGESYDVMFKGLGLTEKHTLTSSMTTRS